MAIGIDQYISRLEITMNNVSGMNILEGAKQVVKDQLNLLIGDLHVLTELEELSEVSLLFLHDHE